MKIQQYKVKQGDTLMTTWLEAGKVKLGSKLTLKKEDGLWEVVEVFDHIQDDKNLRHGWDNNI